MENNDLNKDVYEAAEKAAKECADSFVLTDFYMGSDIKKAIMEAFIAGANWQKEQSPWISVKDHLPMDYNDKLIKLRDGTIRVALYDSDDEEGYFWYDGPASECFSPDDVTHWMPIPK